ncbi:MAG: LysR family transcriptional regulator [Pseudomonadota bacterium]
MNWDDTRYFLAVCRAGSVSAAGKTLGVNHTTVARRIAAFESDLGTRLFDRTREGYVMTQAAENMYDNALCMEEYAQTIDRTMYARDAELRGPLKLTVPYDFANRVLAPILPAFKARYPQIDLELLTTTGLVDLAAREADLAIRLTAKPPDYLVGRKLLPLRHGVYGTRRSLRSMGSEPSVILFRSERDMPEWVREHFPAARVVLRTDNLSTMHAAVAAGLGLARMPCYEVDADRKLKRLDLPLTPSSWGIWVLSHVDLRSTARVRVTREFMADAIMQNKTLILGEASRYSDPA